MSARPNTNIGRTDKYNSSLIRAPSSNTKSAGVNPTDPFGLSGIETTRDPFAHANSVSDSRTSGTG